MIALDINLNGENAWPDLRNAPITEIRAKDIRPASHNYHLGNDAPSIKIAVLDSGTREGKPSVCLRIEIGDGQVVTAETSARLFCTAGRMIMAKYPDLFEDD
jgi:hypothetical protein